MFYIEIMKVFITGTSKGLGWGLAKHYLNIGFNVIGLSRSIPEDLIKNNNYKHITTNLLCLEKIEQDLNPYINLIINN